METIYESAAYNNFENVLPFEMFYVQITMKKKNKIQK